MCVCVCCTVSRRDGRGPADLLTADVVASAGGMAEALLTTGVLASAGGMVEALLTN